MHTWVFVKNIPACICFVFWVAVYPFGEKSSLSSVRLGL